MEFQLFNILIHSQKIERSKTACFPSIRETNMIVYYEALV